MNGGDKSNSNSPMRDMMCLSSELKDLSEYNDGAKRTPFEKQHPLVLNQ